MVILRRKATMANDKTVLCAHVYDQADLLPDYLDWYLDLGVSLLLIQDHGSTDGGREILDGYSVRYDNVMWFPVPEVDVSKYNPGDAMALMAREELGAEWLITSDADEFLRIENGDLRSLLEEAKDRGQTVIDVPCFNMTGPVEGAGRRAPLTLTVRIDRPTTVEVSLDELPVPYHFIRHPQKTITYAPAFRSYGAGTHGADVRWGTGGEIPGVFFLHYPMRGYKVFHKKVLNTVDWFAQNPHLATIPWWGWHWKRWIRLYEAGKLYQEYEAQFVTSEQAEELIRGGTCSLDTTVADWIRAKG
jgi:hypothetical protein